MQTKRIQTRHQNLNSYETMESLPPNGPYLRQSLLSLCWTGQQHVSSFVLAAFHDFSRLCSGLKCSYFLAAFFTNTAQVLSRPNLNSSAKNSKLRTDSQTIRIQLNYAIQLTARSTYLMTPVVSVWSSPNCRSIQVEVKRDKLV